MDTLIPPKIVEETHEDYMNNFVNLLVETTKKSSTYEKLIGEARDLLSRIVDDSRDLMMTAAKNKHSHSRIFIYLIGTHNHINREYHLMFPTGHLAEQMKKYQIPPVFQQVEKYLAPLNVQHKIFEVYRGQKIEITNSSDELLLLDTLTDEIIEEPENPDIMPVEGVKKLKPVRRYVGVITVSWSDRMSEEEVSTD